MMSITSRGSVSTLGLPLSSNTNNNPGLVAFLRSKNVTVTNNPDGTFMVNAPMQLVMQNPDLSAEYTAFCATPASISFK